MAISDDRDVRIPAFAIRPMLSSHGRRAGGPATGLVPVPRERTGIALRMNPWYQAIRE
jgi:hypothetical protein